MSVSVKIEPPKELIKALKKIDDKATSRVTRNALRASAKPMVKEAKSRAKKTSKTVAKSIGVTVKSYQKGTVFSLKMGPRTDDKFTTTKTVKNPFTGEREAREHVPTKTAHLIEGGTNPHQIRLPHLNITIQHPGTDPEPFMEPAFQNNATNAEAAFTKKAWSAIEKESKKAAAKQGAR